MPIASEDLAIEYYVQYDSRPSRPYRTRESHGRYKKEGAVSELEGKGKGSYRHPNRRRIPNLLSGAPLIPGPMTPQHSPLLPSGSGSSYYDFPNYNDQMAIFPAFMLSPSALSLDDEFVRCAIETTVGLPSLFNIPFVVTPSNGAEVSEDFAMDSSQIMLGQDFASSVVGDSSEHNKSLRPKREKSNYNSNAQNSTHRGYAKHKRTARDIPLFESNIDFPVIEEGTSACFSSAVSTITVDSTTPSVSTLGYDDSCFGSSGSLHKSKQSSSKMGHVKFPSKNQLKKKLQE